MMPRGMSWASSGHVWGMSGASSGACLGHFLGHVLSPQSSVFLGEGERERRGREHKA